MRGALLVLLVVACGLAPEAWSATLISMNDTWRFDDTGTDLGDAWQEAAFDDSAWSSGPGVFGYGETYIDTPISFGGDAGNKHPTTYFRITFTLATDPALLTNLTLSANFDDGFVGHLNGVEIVRREMPGGPVSYGTFAGSHEGGAYESIDITSAIPFLVPGTNVLAVEVHQRNASSTDLVWDAELVSSEDPPSAILLPRESTWRIDDTGTDLGAAWTAPGFDDSAWFAGPAELGYGDSWIETEVDFGGNPSAKHPTTYFRTTFFAPSDLSGIKILTLLANYDDGAVCYLNGNEIARLNMPAGAIAYGTFATTDHEAGTYEAVDISSAIPFLLPGANTVAVETHQDTPTSSDLTWDGEIRTGALPALVTRGPYLQVGRTDGVTIRWRTDLPTTSRVRYGGAPGNLTHLVQVAGTRTEHQVNLSGLTLDTKYYYAVGSSEGDLAGNGAGYHFSTHPPVGSTDEIRVWVIGDSGRGNQAARNVRDAYLDYIGGTPADVWLMLGDNAYNTGTDAQYQQAVFDLYPTILRNTILWPTRGNHDDIHTGPNNDYYDIFTMPVAGQSGGLPSGTEAYYSFDYGNVHFVCLDSDGTNRSAGGAMASWLTQDLAASTQTWTIAFWHHPPYSKGSHDSDTESNLVEMRTNLLPILESGGVDLVLAGHSHAYERSFLLDGHYGTSGTLVPSMVIDAGDGSPSGDGPYQKPSAAPTPNDGAVYAVAGSSSQTSGGPLNHPVMVTSLNELGSMVLNIRDNRMYAVFIDDTGAVADDFTILKGSIVDTAPPSVPEATVRVAPNPSRDAVRFTIPIEMSRDVVVRIFDTVGRMLHRSTESAIAPTLTVAWDLRDEAGQAVAPGLYYLVTDTGARVYTKKIVVLK